MDFWSYTWVSRWNECQLKFWWMKHAPEQLRVKDVMSKAGQAGINDHKTLEAIVNAGGTEVTEPHLKGAERWLRKLAEGSAPPAAAEAGYNLDQNFNPILNKFSKNIWLRLRIDAMRWNKSRTKVLIVDWKTGKNTEPDELQAALYPAVLFQLHPALESVTFVYSFTRKPADDWMRTYHRDEAMDLWQPFEEFLQARDAAKASSTYTSSPSYKCGWCPAASKCPDAQSKR